MGGRYMGKDVQVKDMQDMLPKKYDYGMACIIEGLLSAIL
jgi:hypothetical protein